MVEDLALAGLGLGDEAVIEDIEHVLADLLKLGLDLLTVVADDADVLVRALGLLLLLDARDDAPGGTTRADHVLVGDGEKVALVDGKLAADLGHVSVAGKRPDGDSRKYGWMRVVAAGGEGLSVGIPLRLPVLTY